MVENIWGYIATSAGILIVLLSFWHIICDIFNNHVIFSSNFISIGHNYYVSCPSICLLSCSPLLNNDLLFSRLIFQFLFPHPPPSQLISLPIAYHGTTTNRSLEKSRRVENGFLLTFFNSRFEHETLSSAFWDRL